MKKNPKDIALELQKMCLLQGKEKAAKSQKVKELFPMIADWDYVEIQVSPRGISAIDVDTITLHFASHDENPGWIKIFPQY